MRDHPYHPAQVIRIIPMIVINPPEVRGPNGDLTQVGAERRYRVDRRVTPVRNGACRNISDEGQPGPLRCAQPVVQ